MSFQSTKRRGGGVARRRRRASSRGAAGGDAISSTAARWNSAPASVAVDAAAAALDVAADLLPPAAAAFAAAAFASAAFASAAAAPLRRNVATISVSFRATWSVCNVCAMAGSRAIARSARQHNARAASSFGGASVRAPFINIDKSARIPPASRSASRAGRILASKVAAVRSAAPSSRARAARARARFFPAFRGRRRVLLPPRPATPSPSTTPSTPAAAPPGYR